MLRGAGWDGGSGVSTGRGAGAACSCASAFSFHGCQGSALPMPGVRMVSSAAPSRPPSRTSSALPCPPICGAALPCPPPLLWHALSCAPPPPPSAAPFFLQLHRLSLPGGH